MIDLITKSKVRQAMLLLFIYNPRKQYYINEVAKIIKTSAGTTHRELERLAGFGILAKEKKANLVFFKANEKNPLYHDVKNIVEKTIGLELLLKTELKKSKKIEFAFLFGSFVKGGLKPDSDIDLYVIGSIKENELYRSVIQVEEKIKRDINYHLSTRQEFKKNLSKSYFYKEILNKYLLIIGDENEFKKFIKTAAKRR